MDLSDVSLQSTSIESSENKDGSYKPEFTTTQLGGILDCTRVTRNFLCEVIFGRTMEFDTESIFWDRVYDDMDMAPAVCPCVQAPLIGATQEFDRTFFSPAYVKIKHILNACDPLPMMPGERPWGDLSPEERFDVAMARLLAKHDRMISAREEYWAAKVLLDAEYDVEGDLYPKANVNFKRDPCLTWKLSGDQQWGKGSKCGMETLDDAYDKMACTGEGSPVTTHLVMNSTTCRKMKQDEEIRECLKTERGNALIDVQGFDITPVPRPIGGARLAFTIGGVQVWCVDTFYYGRDPKTGKKVKQKYFPDGSVVGLALGNDDCDLQPMKLYGAIKDCEMMRAADRYTTMWKINDPSAKVVMTQSSPLPIVLNANASFHMKVC